MVVSWGLRLKAKNKKKIKREKNKKTTTYFGINIDQMKQACGKTCTLSQSSGQLESSV